MAPGGNPTSVASSAIRSTLSGVCGSGLRTTAQPAASAGASDMIAMKVGEFHGVITATTPSGSRSV